MNKLNIEASDQLSKYLGEEDYPKQFGKIRGFAFALLEGNNDFLQADFNSSSAGQGANSRALYSEAIREIEKTPGLLEDLGGLIPFPNLANGVVIIEMIALGTARERIEKFS